jgi:hypothetical protein
MLTKNVMGTLYIEVPIAAVDIFTYDVKPLPLYHFGQTLSIHRFHIDSVFERRPQGFYPALTTVFLNTENIKLLHDPESDGLLLPAFLGSYENYVCGVPEDRPPKDHTQAGYQTTGASNAPTSDTASKVAIAAAIARTSGAKGAPTIVNGNNMATNAPIAR